MSMTQEDRDRIDYFQKNALPWQLEHVRFRGLGVQVFIPIQGVLLGAWHLTRMPAVAILGIASCVYLYLWDERTRFIIGTVHKMGEKLVDKHLFPVTVDEDEIEGIYTVVGRALRKSGAFRQMRSKTIAIRVLIVTALVIWVCILTGMI